MNALFEFDISDWVDKAVQSDDAEFRQAVHTILAAIASDKNLKANMVLKGGILLAIRYQSHRYTTDIDFSTDHILEGQVTEALIRESLGGSLTYMVESLDYDLDCRIQSSKVQPNDPNATYPSIKLKIGYAYKGSAKHKRLLRLESPTSVSIDYSLNESIPNIDNEVRPRLL